MRQMNISCTINYICIKQWLIMEWKYYKFKKENETIIRFTGQIEYFKDKVYAYEVLKPKRYDDETFKKIVKKVLTDSDIPLGTTDLWHKCLDCELLLSRETFLKRLRKLDDDDICLSVVGSSYTWSMK